MNITIDYTLAIERPEVLVNKHTGKAEYSIIGIDFKKKQFSVSAIYRKDKIKIPWSRIESAENIEKIIIDKLPEYLI